MREIEDFLSLHRLALVGVSRKASDFSRLLFRDLVKRGYDVVPVNPKAEGTIEERVCYAHVRDIPEPVEGVIVMTPADQSLTVCEDCARAGVDFVWLHRGAGKGALSSEAVAFCEDHEMTVVPGQCPFMFLPKSGAIHKVHGLFKKMARTYPS